MNIFSAADLAPSTGANRRWSSLSLAGCPSGHLLPQPFQSNCGICLWTPWPVPWLTDGIPLPSPKSKFSDLAWHGLTLNAWPISPNVCPRMTHTSKAQKTPAPVLTGPDTVVSKAEGSSQKQTVSSLPFCQKHWWQLQTAGPGMGSSFLIQVEVFPKWHGVESYEVLSYFLCFQT